MDLTTRLSLVQNLLTNKELPVSTGAELLDVNRTSIYYKAKGISDEEIECKRIIDHLHTDNPTWGARQMAAQLKLRGYIIGRKRVRRYMTEMAIDPIYPKPNLSKRLKQAQVVPYLLRNAEITAPNQAWSIDITYIPIHRGFLYLTAIIDWHTRCIVLMIRLIQELVYKAKGKYETLANLVIKGRLTLEEAAEEANVSITEFKEKTGINI